MANLCTIEHLRSLNRMRIAHAITTVGVLTAIMAAISTIALVPSWYIARQEYAATKAEITILTEAIEERSGKTGVEALQEGRDLLTVAEGIAARSTRMTEALSAVHITDPGIDIVRVSYEYYPQASTITVSGEATSREVFVSYVDALRKDGRFKNISAPVATMARTGGPFSVTVVGDF